LPKTLLCLHPPTHPPSLSERGQVRSANSGDSHLVVFSELLFAPEVVPGASSDSARPHPQTSEKGSGHRRRASQVAPTVRVPSKQLVFKPPPPPSPPTDSACGSSRRCATTSAMYPPRTILVYPRTMSPMYPMCHPLYTCGHSSGVGGGGGGVLDDARRRVQCDTLGPCILTRVPTGSPTPGLDPTTCHPCIAMCHQNTLCVPSAHAWG
jgi:hypothetical protein